MKIVIYGYGKDNTTIACSVVELSTEAKLWSFLNDDIGVDNALSIIRDAAITAGIKEKIVRTLVLFNMEV